MMELLGFSRWAQINEQEGSSEAYLLRFKNPHDDQEDRKELFYQVLNRELATLYPNYKVDIEDGPGRNANITFHYQDDEFSLFGDTGSTKPVTIKLEYTGVSVFTAIQEWSLKKLGIYGNIFKTPGLGNEFILTIKKDPLEVILKKSASEIENRNMYAQSIYTFTEPIAPGEEKLDELAFGKELNIQSFEKELSKYINYKSYIAYLKSAIVGPYNKTTDDYRAEIEPKVTEALQMDFNGVDQVAIEELMPIIQDLYFHSNEKRAESKIATPLLVKLLLSIKEKSGNLNEFLFKVNLAGAKSRKGANKFM